MSADLQYVVGMGVFFASAVALAGFVTFLVRKDARVEPKPNRRH